MKVYPSIQIPRPQCKQDHASPQKPTPHPAWAGFIAIYCQVFDFFAWETAIEGSADICWSTLSSTQYICLFVCLYIYIHIYICLHNYIHTYHTSVHIIFLRDSEVNRTYASAQYPALPQVKNTILLCDHWFKTCPTMQSHKTYFSMFNRKSTEVCEVEVCSPHPKCHSLSAATQLPSSVEGPWSSRKSLVAGQLSLQGWKIELKIRINKQKHTHQHALNTITKSKQLHTAHLILSKYI